MYHFDAVPSRLWIQRISLVLYTTESSCVRITYSYLKKLKKKNHTIVVLLVYNVYLYNLYCNAADE